MKKLHHTFFLLCGIVVAFSTTSCIKDEKANVECDIENIVVAQEDLITYTKIDRDRAIVSLKRKSVNFESEINPTYIVSDGATYTIENETDKDAVHIEYVKVTSEDKQYSKTYTVLFTPTEIPAHFGFEYWAVDGKYEKSYEHGMTITNDDGQQNTTPRSTSIFGIAVTSDFRPSPAEKGRKNTLRFRPTMLTAAAKPPSSLPARPAR